MIIYNINNILKYINNKTYPYKHKYMNIANTLLDVLNVFDKIEPNSFPFYVSTYKEEFKIYFENPKNYYPIIIKKLINLIESNTKIYDKI